MQYYLALAISPPDGTEAVHGGVKMRGVVIHTAATVAAGRKNTQIYIIEWA
jgi:hypothetical protein